MFGGILTAALLIKLAIRRLWSQALVVAGISFAAAAPALALATVQIHSMPENFALWITTTPITSVRYSLGMVRHAASNNLAAIASAVVVTFLFLKDGRKSSDLRIAIYVAWHGWTVSWGLLLANAMRPLIIYRYLIAAAGAVTFAVAILASACGSSVWVPASVSVVALFATSSRSILNSRHTTIRLASHSAGYSAVEIRMRHDQNFCLSFDVASRRRACSSVKKLIPLFMVITQRSLDFHMKTCGRALPLRYPARARASFGLKHLLGSGANTEVEQVLHEFRISKIEEAELKRYNSGALIIVR